MIFVALELNQKNKAYKNVILIHFDIAITILASTALGSEIANFGDMDHFSSL
jgi:hypothetical protein